jgi:hypothetical protein
VVQKAEQYTPGAVDVASGLNIAASTLALRWVPSSADRRSSGMVWRDAVDWAVIVLVALLLVVRAVV